MSFWANYVLIKEVQGQDREVVLNLIEAKFGEVLRYEIENELS